MAATKRSPAPAATSANATAAPSARVVSAPVGNPNTTAPASKPWLLVGALVASLLTLLAVDSSRTHIFSFSTSHPIATLFTTLLVLAVAFYCFTLIRTDEWRGGGASGLYRHSDYVNPDGVNTHIDQYNAQFSATSRKGDGSHERMIAQRQKNYMQMVNHFYDVVTDFYEYAHTLTHTTTTYTHTHTHPRIRCCTRQVHSLTALVTLLACRGSF